LVECLVAFDDALEFYFVLCENFLLSLEARNCLEQFADVVFQHFDLFLGIHLTPDGVFGASSHKVFSLRKRIINKLLVLLIVEEMGLHLSKLHLRPLNFSPILDFCLQECSFERLDLESCIASDLVDPRHKGGLLANQLHLHRRLLLSELFFELSLGEPQLVDVLPHVGMAEP